MDVSVSLCFIISYAPATNVALLSVLGWGDGRHPCPGKRWAKLQTTITVAYALAGWKWVSIDDGVANKSTSDGGHGTVLSSKLVKFVRRDE